MLDLTTEEIFEMRQAIASQVRGLEKLVADLGDSLAMHEIKDEAWSALDALDRIVKKLDRVQS